MAGDWIPMRLDLREDPSVIYMAEKLECREEVVVGYLHAIWSWASRQCHDGSVTNVTLLSLGRVTNLFGFPELMRDAGWLIEGTDDQGRPFIEFPNWDNWLSESAKKRLRDAKRQANYRKSKEKQAKSEADLCHASVTKMSQKVCDKSVTTGENSTEENKEKKKEASPLFSLPTRDGTRWHLTQQFLDKLGQAYPKIRLEMRKHFQEMDVWLVANPTKMKSHSGMSRFVNTWLKKANDEKPEPERIERAPTIAETTAARRLREAQALERRSASPAADGGAA